MARPLKLGMDYFPHDTDASNDEKVDALRMLYGNDGYAFYFILLERIYRTPDFELDVSDAETIQILARKVEVTPEKFTEMLQTAIKRNCFCAESYEKRRVLTSPGIKKRAAGVVQKRQKMADTYRKRVSDAETPPETPQSKVKKSKVKDTNVSKRKTILVDNLKQAYRDNVRLKVEEFDMLVKKHGEEFVQRCLDKLANYKLANGKHYQSDYGAINSWVIAEIEKSQTRPGQHPFTTHSGTDRPQPTQSPKGLAALNQ